MTKYIVLIEPSPVFGERLAYSLKGEGLEMLTQRTASQLLGRSGQRMPSLVLVRDGPQDADGASAVRTLREAGYPAPVLVIGASPDSSDMIKCLDLGADDYVAMSCDRKELLLRMRNLIRQ
jgi:two-component system phosphate regulon response regulator OmpR